MDRRDFMGASVGACLAASRVAGRTAAAATSDLSKLVSPLETRLAVRPVMTSMVHTGVWEGPCRWNAVSVGEEKRRAEASFAQWSTQISQQLGGDPAIEVLPPVQVTFSEDFKLTKDQLRKLTRDGKQADVVFLAPHGSSIASFDVGKHLKRPIIVQGLSCRTVDISAYSRSKGLEAYVPANSDELRRLLVLLRARKVFRQTRVLFPTDWKLPAVASVTSINDLADLEKRHGVGVKQITYDDLAKAMDATLSNEADREVAARVADELIKNAQNTLIDRDYVVSSLQFYRTIARLMNQHECNAFTIECFEFCSSRLPEKWKITPCLVHTLLKDLGHASSCEADLGGLLSMRLLMSVSRKSSHLGNMFLRPGVLAINHSASGLKMNGYDQPKLPYKLGRFVESGWGTKFVVDFMNNDEKRVTVVRIDPTATRMLVLKGKLVGADGWDGDNLGCSVEARVVPVEGTAEDFARKQTDYGNHLVWGYGHYADELEQLGAMLGMEVEVVG